MGRILGLLLVSVASLSNAAAASGHNPDADAEASLHRQLQSRPCGSTLGMITAEEVREAGRIAMANIVDTSLVEGATNVAFRNAIYDVQVVKTCTTCQSLFDYYLDVGREWPSSHFDYCGDESYGTDVTQSALAFIPQGLVRTKIRGYISLLGSPASRTAGPSSRFPANFANLLDQVQADTSPTAAFTTLLSDFLPALQAGASGAVAIIPDYIGYGESIASNRATFFTNMYQQSATIHWLEMERYLNTTTAGCLLLNKDAVTVHCVDDGVLGCAGAVNAFQRLDANSLQVLMGPGPLDLATFLTESYALMGTGGIPAGSYHEGLLGQAALAYSIETPGMANTGTGETMAAASQIGSLQGIFGPSSSSAILPADLTTIFNSELVARLNAASSLGVEVCPSSNIPGLCYALGNASAWPNLLSETTINWNYETVWCNSPDNEVFSNAHAPDNILAVPEIRVYKGAFGLEEELLPRGNHQLAKEYCNMNSFVFFTLENELHRPSVDSETANYRIPLSAEEAAMCLQTASPSMATDIAPAVAPATSPSGGGGGTPSTPTGPTPTSPTGPTPTSPTPPTDGNPTPTPPTDGTPTAPTTGGDGSGGGAGDGSGGGGGGGDNGGGDGSNGVVTALGGPVQFLVMLVSMLWMGL